MPDSTLRRSQLKRVFLQIAFTGFFKDRGYTKRAGRATLGDEKRHIEGFPIDIQQLENINFLDELDLFWTNRNKCLHQIVKSGPGEDTINIDVFTELASQTAVNGLELVKKVNNWAKKFKRKK